ncbi:VWA domain-containing protein [uncultured Thiothrix sp.]|uniref:vWA domain-containing protein n=1 Tax=uncultured Thiothrix sp. TaxID=223185 RepID=UPI00261F53C8|nr:VWA domain-containing protein [uncultured Thiothrix sp.]
MNKRFTFSTALFLGLSSFAVQASDKTILVLDASGSMWEQIDGKPKIEIARQALKSILADWPADQELGLVAYGHRSKGDCKDIETLIPVGPLDAAKMGKTVDSLIPKGKTPLSAAVKQAAEALKYTEEKATVILISDGKETCAMDPCALGTELEKAGVNFTAHVIGFDVAKVEDQAGLKCLAENTGGKFIAAANASELNKALVETVQAPVVEAAAPPPEPPKPEPAPPPKASITAPASAEKGTLILIEHQAEKPGIEGHVYIYAQGKEQSITYSSVHPDGESYKPTELRLPATVGEYVLRWKDGQEQLLAETKLNVTEASIALKAPESAPKGTLLKVGLSAPADLEGHVHIFAKGKDKSITYGYVRPNPQGGYLDAELRLPAEPGDYEIKWLTDRNELLAQAPLQVTDSEIKLTVPASASKATLLKVGLTAPAHLEGHVHIFAKGKDQSITYGYVRPNPQGGYLDAELRLPAEPGDYEIKWLSDRNELLAATPIQVTDSEIKLEAPSSAPKGTSLKIGLIAPDGLEGHVHIFAKGKDESITYGYVRENAIKGYDPAELSLPAQPGDYELKWISDRNEVLASAPIQVTDAEISLSAPEQVQKSTEIQIALKGPDGLTGHVHLFAKGKDQSITYGYVRANSTQGYEPATLTVPDQLGDYTLRWLTERNEVLAEAPLQVVEQISE